MRNRAERLRQQATLKLSWRSTSSGCIALQLQLGFALCAYRKIDWCGQMVQAWAMLLNLTNEQLREGLQLGCIGILPKQFRE